MAAEAKSSPLQNPKVQVALVGALVVIIGLAIFFLLVGGGSRATVPTGAAAPGMEGGAPPPVGAGNGDAPSPGAVQLQAQAPATPPPAAPEPAAAAPQAQERPVQRVPSRQDPFDVPAHLRQQIPPPPPPPPPPPTEFSPPHDLLGEWREPPQRPTGTTVEDPTILESPYPQVRIVGIREGPLGGPIVILQVGGPNAPLTPVLTPGAVVANNFYLERIERDGVVLTRLTGARDSFRVPLLTEGEGGLQPGVRIPPRPAGTPPGGVIDGGVIDGAVIDF